MKTAHKSASTGSMLGSNLQVWSNMNKI